MTRLFSALGALLLCLVVAVSAHAQEGETKKSPFGVPLAPGQSTSVPAQKVERSFLGDVWSYVLTQQQRLNRELAGPCAR